LFEEGEEQGRDRSKKRAGIPAKRVAEVIKKGGSFNNQQSWQESDAPTGLCITAQGWPRNEAYPGINVGENLYPNGVVSGG